MQPSSRTPEGWSNHCPLCGHLVRIEPSLPPGDAPCPACGNLLWFRIAGVQSDETSAQLALRDPDVRLMQRVRGDEAGAFEELVERYQHRLVAVMHHLVGNAEKAEDLAQEVFLRVYRARKSYHPRSRFSTWLFTIANNLALNLD